VSVILPPPLFKVLTVSRLYFTGTGSFDWSVDPYYSCNSPSDTSIQCYWYDDTATLQPGVPYDIPKVKASLINVLPPDYGQPQSLRIASVPNPRFAADTVRVKGDWELASGGK
jgi:hypothetical protein